MYHDGTEIEQSGAEEKKIRSWGTNEETKYVFFFLFLKFLIYKSLESMTSSSVPSLPPRQCHPIYSIFRLNVLK